jgi:hypothetical protein
MDWNAFTDRAVEASSREQRHWHDDMQATYDERREDDVQTEDT